MTAIIYAKKKRLKEWGLKTAIERGSLRPSRCAILRFYLAWYDIKASNVIAGDVGGSHALVARAMLIKKKSKLRKRPG